MKNKLIAIFCVLLAGCVTTPPRLVNQNDAAVRFAKLGPGGRETAQQFYDLGAGDTIQRLYWAQRESQKNPSTAEASPVEKLERRYVNIPVPEHIEPDGTIKEASTHAVEIVQLWSATPNRGRKLFIVK